MNTYLSLLKKCAGLLIAASLASAALGQGVLIGLSTRNGSFENGALPPWSGYGSQLSQDPLFASEGTYYVSLQSSGVLPVSIGQRLSPSSDAGLRFLLTFDARVEEPSLNLVSVLMSGRTPEGNPLSASVVPIAAPPLSTSAWQRYEYQLRMPESWDASGFTFGISFSKNQPLGGVTHYAYLDNVVLTQIPEPSALALVGIGGLLLAGTRLCRRSPACDYHIAHGQHNHLHRQHSPRQNRNRRFSLR